METKEFLKNFLSRLVRGWVGSELQGQREPQRARLKKGHSIGPSLNQQRAARWMVLYSYGKPFTLVELAGLAEVPKGGMLAWHTMDNFSELVKKTSEAFGGILANTINVAIMEKYIPIRPEIRAQLAGKRVFDIDLKGFYPDPGKGSTVRLLEDCLLMTNSFVQREVIRRLKEEVDRRKPGDPGGIDCICLLYRIMRSAHRQVGTLKDFDRSGENLEMLKNHVAYLIKIFVELVRGGAPLEAIEEYSKMLKGEISAIIGSLAV